MRKTIPTAMAALLIAGGIGATRAGEVSRASSSEPLATLLIDDFNDGTPRNSLDGDANTWGLDPYDEEQGCKAWIESGEPRVPKDKYLRIDYDVDSSKRAANGYWSHLRMLDASPYDHLQFWVRGDPKAGFSTRFKIEFKKDKKDEHGKALPYEKLTGSFMVQGVTDQWQQISIPLNVMNGILRWDELKELVFVFKDRMMTDKQGTLYIDDIRLVKTGDPGPGIEEGVERRVEKGIRGLDAVQAAEFLIEKRLGGFPEKLFPDREFPADDREFLLRVARDTWRFFEYFTDRHNGLPLDTIALSTGGVLTEETFVGDYTNVTNIGMYLMAVVSARDLGFIDDEEAKRRLSQTMTTLGTMETAKGFHYNYYDTTTLERTSHFLSCVDSGWLAIGLYVVRNAYPELAGQANALLGKMDFGFLYDDVEQHMYHGYYMNIDYFSEYHYGSFYTEPRAISYMAIGRGDVPEDHWFALVRTFPEDYYWQQQQPMDRVEKDVLGHRFFGGYYEADGIRYVPSWGGSLFEALMPTLVLQERVLAPKGLGINNRNHVRMHIQAMEKLKYPVWGMSPSSVPGGGYSEFGLAILGAKGYKPGVVTPHVTFLGLEYAPEQALANLRKMIELYDIYGECGFFDAVDPLSGEVAMKWLCLDQAMSFIALNNYLNDGAIRKYFHADPIFKDIEHLLTDEYFFEKQ